MITVEKTHKSLVAHIRRVVGKNGTVTVTRQGGGIRVAGGGVAVTLSTSPGEPGEVVRVPGAVLDTLPVGLRNTGTGDVEISYPSGVVMTQPFSPAAVVVPQDPILGTLTLPPGFLQALARVAPAMSRDGSRHTLNGVSLRAQTASGAVRVAGCDGRMLRVADVGVVCPGLDIIVSAEMVAQLLRVRWTGEVYMSWGAGHVAFRAGAVEIEGALVEGTYPNYDVVTPPPGEVPLAVTVVAENLAAAVEAMKPVWRAADNGVHSIALHVGNNAIVLEGTAGASRMPVAASIPPGGHVAIAFAPRLLLVLLGTFDGSVCLRFADELAPALMGVPGVDYAVLMPVRLS